MAGVTHFERRDLAGRKKVHPTCPFASCGYRLFRTTPKTISKAGGPRKYIESYKEHLLDHLAGHERDEVQIRAKAALEAMAEFAPGVWANC